MFHFLQKYKVLHIFILFVLTFLLGGQTWQGGFCFSDLESQQSYTQTLDIFLETHSLLFSICTITLFVLQLLLMFIYYRNSNFSDKNILFPLFWMLFFAISGQYFSPTSPVFIINFIITLLLIINQSKFDTSYRSRALLSGLFIGIATLYDAAATLLLIYIIAVLIINSSKIFKNICVLLIGFITTYIYVFAYHFFAGDLVGYYTQLIGFQNQFPLFTTIRFSNIQFIALAVLILMFPYIMVRIKIAFDNKLILVRKSIISLHILLAVTISMVLITNIPHPQSFSYLAIPLTIYYSTLQQSEKLVIANEVVLTLSAIAILAIQYSNLLSWN